MKQLNYIFIAIVILLTATSVYAQNEIPSSIIEKSNQFIISNVGEDFFNKYITVNYDLSEYYPAREFCVQNPDSCAAHSQQPHYLMVYSFKVPEKSYVDELLEFAVDTDGNVILERDVTGIPECITHPEECDFPVDEAQAIQIARDAGLEDGITSWETSFHWYAGELKTYVWTVQNTLSAPSSGPESGKTALIDANSGEVKMVSNWLLVSDSSPIPSTTPTQSETNIFLYISIVIIALLILVFVIWIIIKKNKTT